MQDAQHRLEGVDVCFHEMIAGCSGRQNFACASGRLCVETALDLALAPFQHGEAVEERTKTLLLRAQARVSFNAMGNELQSFAAFQKVRPVALVFFIGCFKHLLGLWGLEAISEI